jgi:hypothetical protein
MMIFHFDSDLFLSKFYTKEKRDAELLKCQKPLRLVLYTRFSRLDRPAYEWAPQREMPVQARQV